MEFLFPNKSDTWAPKFLQALEDLNFNTQVVIDIRRKAEEIPDSVIEESEQQRHIPVLTGQFTYYLSKCK